MARLVPAATDGGDARERLVKQGVVRPGRGGATWILEEPPMALPVSISDALAEDRADRL